MSSLAQEKAYILYDKNTNILDITLKYDDDELNIHRGFNFQRKASEQSSRFLTRISENISKVINKKIKNKVDKTNKIDVNLISKEDGKICESDNLSCFEAFVSTHNYNLKIKNVTYMFDVNPPILSSLELPKKNIMAGFYLYPYKLEGINCNISETVLKWFRTKEKFESYEKLKMNNMLANLEWEEIGQGFLNLTSNDDVSRLFKV